LDTTTNLGKTDPPPVATPMRFDNKLALRQHAAYQPSRNNARKAFKFNEVIFAESLTPRHLRSRKARIYLIGAAAPTIRRP
jgi:hypothetical protein